LNLCYTTFMSMFVYSFSRGRAEGSGAQKALLGGKGAGLSEMCRLGIPVPPGFTITTEVCGLFLRDQRYPDKLREQVEAALQEVEAAVGSGARFGDPSHPLLLSVRSGARVSMPGMMDTVLNLGLNDATVEGLAARSGSRRFAFDSYRRFVQMYGDVVMGLKPESPGEKDPFEALIHEHKARRGIELDTELSEDDLVALVAAFKAEILRRTGRPFPEDPMAQLWEATSAVFRSWDNPRAITYRRLYNIPASDGTAVTVQAMVFGNQGEGCATGVAFTRDPATGERRFYGEFLENAQGEDVVAGIRTPRPIAELMGLLPSAHRQLIEIAAILERHFRDMQDIEFTIQNGALWMLQTRTGKRSGRAMVKIAVDMVAEGLISKEEALLRVDPTKLDELLHPRIDPTAKKEVLGKGLPASPGAATGRVVFSADDAEEMVRRGERVILVRTETSPEDIHGMKAAEGILTARGGMTSHAAVVARGMGKCCVVGLSALQIDYGQKQLTLGGATVGRGDVLTLDGGTGEVMLGAVPMTAAHTEMDGEYNRLMGWVDEARRLRVRANADTPLDARTARRFGAEGIGLCRTEHMFFQPERILAVRQMILSTTTEARRQALAKILPMQREDFIAIFGEMQGLPVTIRLLDPPLHEFLPTAPEEIERVAEAMGTSASRVRKYIELLHEQNPMLGHRGCRLGVTYPEIYEVQVQAILEAAAAVQAQGLPVEPEIMVPLVGHEAELARLRALIDRVAAAVSAQGGGAVPYTVGTMIELPRACVVADRIAQQADFFSFGTNDLTQTTLGVSRDDAGHFLPRYVELGIYEADPFVSVDTIGVGALVEMAVSRGRAQRAGMKMGVCGEHGGDPRSIAFFHAVGLDYVSCSPFRVPIARLAAAQAALRKSGR
jgi:pyruvate,orthophosphate dikinase